MPDNPPQPRSTGQIFSALFFLKTQRVTELTRIV